MNIERPSNQNRATDHASRRRNREGGDDTRNKLLAGTIEVLLEKGYAGFRVADAAAAAGVSRGAQTHHFPTKEALVEAVITKVFESELGASEAAAATAEDSQILKGAALHAAEFLNSEQYHIASNLIISGRNNPELVEKIQKISAQSREPIEEAWIKRLQRLGVSPNEAEDVLWVLWSVLRAVAMRKRYCGSGSHDNRTTAFTLELLDEHLDELLSNRTTEGAKEQDRVVQRQEERSEQTRKKLLDAAVKIILERGCAGLRSADVSDVAGISRGGQLHHFPSKDILVAAVLERTLAEATSETTRRIDEIWPDGDSLVEAIVQDAKGFFFGDAYRVAIDILMSGGSDAEMAAALDGMPKRLLGPECSAWIGCISGIGVDSGMAQDIVWFLWSVVHGLAIRGLASRSEQREARVVALALTLASRRLKILRTRHATSADAA